MSPHHFVIVYDSAAQRYRFFQVYANSIDEIRANVEATYREQGWETASMGVINSFPFSGRPSTSYYGAFVLSAGWYKTAISGKERYHLHSLTFEATLESDGTLYLSGAALQEGFAAGEVRALKRFLDEVPLPPLPDDFETFTFIEGHDEQGPDMESMQRKE